MSYKTQDVFQSELTPQKLFDGRIGKDIQDDFGEEKGTIEQIVENVLKKMVLRNKSFIYKTQNYFLVIFF